MSEKKPDRVASSPNSTEEGDESSPNTAEEGDESSPNTTEEGDEWSDGPSRREKFRHVYGVVNLGPSAVDALRLSVRVPLLGSYFYLSNISVADADGKFVVGNCENASTVKNPSFNLTVDNAEPQLKRSTMNTSADSPSAAPLGSGDKTTITLDCESAEYCIWEECAISGRLAPHRQILVTIELTTDAEALGELTLQDHDGKLTQPEEILYATRVEVGRHTATSVVEHGSTLPVFQPEDGHADSATVVTDIIVTQKMQATSLTDVPWWVIASGVGGGVLLLLISLFLLYKCGCCKRKQKAQLQELRRKTQAVLDAGNLAELDAMLRGAGVSVGSEDLYRDEELADNPTEGQEMQEQVPAAQSTRGARRSLVNKVL